jgi:hypothetical protein
MDTPRKAEITQTHDDGEPEVTSKAPPGAPTKPPRPPANRDHLQTIARNLNPELAAAASFLNDPVQTEAMAKFAEGKMSYAEMRGLCG